MAKFLSIEVDSVEVRAAVVEKVGKGKRVMRSCFSFATPQGAVEDGYIRDTVSLGDALKKNLEKRHIKAKKAYFAVTSSRIASREVRIPYVKESQIQNILMMNITDYFPIDISKYVVSYSVVDIEESKAEETEEKKKARGNRQYHLMVYAAPSSISASYQELTESAGLKLAGIDYVGDSLYQAVKQEFASGTNMILKIEEQGTLLTIVKDGELALQRNINYGVDALIDVVKNDPVWGCQGEEREALELLCAERCIGPTLEFDEGRWTGAGRNLTDRRLEARVDATGSLSYLISNISRIMDYYVSRNVGTVYGDILICGVGAKIDGLSELLTNEIGQDVGVLVKLAGCRIQGEGSEELSSYVALDGICNTTVNLMEKVTKKQKKDANDIRGSLVIFGLGAVGAVAMALVSVGSRVYQEERQSYLNMRIREERSIQEIYDAYMHMKQQYDGFVTLYGYTNTPNENLVAFLEELQEKVPSDIVIDSFSSTGTDVAFNATVNGKSQAANLLMQLRTFESLAEVTTSGINEDETGRVTLAVSCTYAEPAGQ